MQPSVLVVGAANLDVVAETDRPQPGQSVPGRVRFGPGGAARNVAENLGRLGARTCLLCAVGVDPLSDLVVHGTEQVGVRVSAQRHAERPDLYVAVISRGERLWAVSDLSNCEGLRPEHVQRFAREYGPAQAVVVDSNLSEETLATAVGVAPRAALLTVSPVKALRLRPHLRGTWLLVCSAAEAEALTGVPVNGPEGALQAAQVLVGVGCGTVVVTLGSSGLVWVGERALYAPAPSVPAVDPTGAGDAVAACAVYGLLRGIPPEELARICVWAGALTVGVEGSNHPDLSWEVLLGKASSC